MKKLSFLFAMIFAVSMAMGQNTSTTSQTGDNNDANIGQTGANNNSVILQERYSGAPVSVSAVNDNVYDLTQDGNRNISKLSQNWGSSEAIIDQVGDDNVLTNSKTFTQSNYFYGDDGFAVQGGSDLYLNQVGNRNEAGIYQRAKDNWADIDQLGDDNKTDVYQYSFGGTAPPVFGNDATVLQDGNNNDSEVSQSGDLGSSGRSNSATVAILGDENITVTKQYGNLNTASTNIGSYVSSYNEVSIDQLGNSNYASFGLQKGDNNLVTIDQDGDNNYTELSVKYGDDNELTELVNGDANRTRLHVKTAWGGMSSDNIVSISKTGDGNYVAGSIEGDDNDVTIMQDGTNNRVGTSWYTNDGVSIVGSMNDIDISQTGMGNSSLNSITGSSNVISVTQSN